MEDLTKYSDGELTTYYAGLIKAIAGLKADLPAVAAEMKKRGISTSNENDMKNTPKQVYDYLASLEESDRAYVLARMEEDQNGNTYMGPADEGGCTAANCHDHVGCQSGGLVNYYCGCSNGNCVAIPEFGA